MPFELGLDLGCKYYRKKNKRCLILEEKPYRYNQVISDISGQDISSHNNEPILVVKAVRNWLYSSKLSNNLKSYTQIWDFYNEFHFDFEKDLKAENLNPNKFWEIPFSELINYIDLWILAKKQSLDLI